MNWISTLLGNLNYGTVTYGGAPIIDELYIYNLQGMLVTYYIRGVQTADSLTVKYVDDTTAGRVALGPGTLQGV